MKVVDLITEFLLSQGVQSWSIARRASTSVSGWGISDVKIEEIIVYLNGNKLHFIIEETQIDCAEYYGGMATPMTGDNLIKICLPRTSIHDPDFFKKLLNGIGPMKLGHPSVAVKEL